MSPVVEYLYRSILKYKFEFDMVNGLIRKKVDRFWIIRIDGDGQLRFYYEGYQ